LVTETMLVDGVNVSNKNALEIADLLMELNPSKAYLSVPTRPPTLISAKPPTESTLNNFFQIVSARFENLEYMIGYNSLDHPATGNVGLDLLDLLSFKPMGSFEVRNFLDKHNPGWKVVEMLLKNGEIVETKYLKDKYYLRKINMEYALSH
ncbi:radical SAM protein, partial [bacterium]|nr:radical SAM protein [bacterium]MBU1024481.1 radical SAM protein [bacterium]